MHKSLLFVFFALLAFSGSIAHASNHITCINSTNVPDTSLIAFDFDIAVPISNGGGGSSAGKPTTALSVVIPLSSNYAALSNLTLNGTHSSSCTLTESPSSSVSVQISVKDVLFSDLKIVKGTYYNPAANGTPVVELTLSYSSYSIQTN
jgi:hypothetical protein